MITPQKQNGYGANEHKFRFGGQTSPSGKSGYYQSRKAVAAIVDIALFERIRKLDEEFDEVSFFVE